MSTVKTIYRQYYSISLWLLMKVSYFISLTFFEFQPEPVFILLSGGGITFSVLWTKQFNLGSVDWSADGKFLYIRNYKSLKLINCWKLIFNKFYGFVPGIPGLVFIIHCCYKSYYVFICINTPKKLGLHAKMSEYLHHW